MKACSVVPSTHERCVSVVYTLLMPAEQYDAVSTILHIHAVNAAA